MDALIYVRVICRLVQRDMQINLNTWYVNVVFSINIGLDKFTAFTAKYENCKTNRKT